MCVYVCGREEKKRGRVCVREIEPLVNDPSDVLGLSSNVPLHLPGVYKFTSLIRKRTPLGPYRGPMPRVLGGSQGSAAQDTQPPGRVLCLY